EASIGKVSEALANFTQAAAEIEVSPIQEAEAEERAAEEEEASATAEVEAAQPVQPAPAPHLQEQQPAAAREAAAHEPSFGKAAEAQPVHVEQSVQLVQPVQPVQPAPASHLQDQQPAAREAQPVHVEQLVQLVQPAQPVQPAPASHLQDQQPAAREAQPVHVEQSVQLVQPVQPVQPAPASHLQDQQPAAREATVGQAADSAEAAQKSEVQALADEVAAVALQGFAQPADGKEAASAATTLQPVQEVPERSLQRKESLDELLAPETLDLPPGWEAVWSNDHEAYYFWHEPTDTVQWEPPDSPKAEAFRSMDSDVTEVLYRAGDRRDSSDSALAVLNAAAADLEQFVRQGSGTQRSSLFSKGSRKFSTEEQRAPDLSSQTEAFQTRQRQSVQAAAMASTGLPRFLRPGLVDMAALNKLERTKMDLRFRRNRIGDQRREKYPIPSQVEYNRMNSTTQGVFHCHVHHHVHHNGMEKQIQPTSKPPDLWEGSGGEGREGREGATLEPLKEFQSKPKRLSKQGISKSAAEILRTAPAEYGPVGFAGPGLRKARRGASPPRCKSEAKLAPG
ncbi:unnamed protein product, partial [Effrenium voratum]